MNIEFKTIEEQIEILKQRNLSINEEKAKEIFRDNNYYYLINGYKNLFIDENSKEEKYKDDATLEEIFALYRFDSELRNVFLKYILNIERRIDTYIAYEFSKQYGEQNYLIGANFNNNSKITDLRIKSLIADINSNISTQIRNGNRMLSHYITQYGYIPLWVLIRIITFGQVSKFYDLMKQQDQNKVAKKFGVREKELKTYIHNLAIIRNICAHDEKLYDIRLQNAIIKNDIHKHFNLVLQDGKYTNGYKDLFSIVIILKVLLKEEEFKEFYTIATNMIKELKQEISSIDFSQVLDKMGFLESYEELLK